MIYFLVSIDEEGGKTQILLALYSYATAPLNCSFKMLQSPFVLKSQKSCTKLKLPSRLNYKDLTFIFLKFGGPSLK